VNCPYSEKNCPPDLAANVESCPGCGQFLRNCPRCAAPNRAFANFCRSCGATLPAGAGDWLAYKGSARRLGVNSGCPEPDRAVAVQFSDVLKLRLGDSCRALLGYDRHLIAVSQSGAVEICDARRPSSVRRFQAQGPISAEPCIDRGILYLGSHGQLAAYSLGAAMLGAPRTRPLWQVPLSGPPVQALTVIGSRLYLTVAVDGRREVQVIDRVDAPRPAARSIQTAARVSWIAGDTAAGKAVFLSEDNGHGVHLRTIGEDHDVAHAVSLHAFAEHPIAYLGGKVFGIFGDARRLYRIDAASGAVDEPLEDDTQFFSLTHDRDFEWDRDGVRIDTRGVLFSRIGVRDSFSHVDRAARCSPVIMQGRAAAVGMEDGRVLLYDLLHPPKHEVWRPGSDGTVPITALASFGPYIAAGNAAGVVEVRELRLQEGTP